MDSNDLEAELATERRKRLAAERMLELKKEELVTANKQLNDHALSLSGQIIDQRRVVDTLQGENTKFSEDLERATFKAVEMERLLWAALESIPDGFAIFDPDLRLIAANRPYLQVFDDAGGIEPGDSYQTIVEHCIDDGLVDLGGTPEDDWYDMMLDRWEHDAIDSITLRFWNGMYVRLNDRRTADGGVVSLVLNITSDMRRERELTEARDKAQAADRAKSAFLAKMSHELRTPMNGVVGMADLLLEREQDEEAQLYTQTIKNSSHALLEIINNILDFSKIEADKFELNIAPFNLEQLAQNVCLILGPALREKPVELLMDYDQFLPTEFMGDAGRLRQILLNLMGNAVKFTEEGTVMLRIVGLSDMDDSSCQLHVTIEDTGIGIPPEKIDHIFGEFNQIEDEANRKYEGTGLGLSITRKLIELMGGEIWLDSVQGHGSCFGFKITLPCADIAEANKPDVPAALSDILVLTDNKLEQALLERQLSLLGISARFIDTWNDCEAALQQSDFQVLLTRPSDQSEAQSRLPQAGGTIAHLTYAEQFGEEADLPKPFTRSGLLSALCRAIEPEEAPQTSRKVKVLAAEDNKTNQLVLTKMLSPLDIELTLVNNGQEAVDSFKDMQPDIVFLDISMPIMDGLEAASLIRKASGGETIPLVAMTAHALAGDEERIRAGGFDHYMTKPLKKAELAEHISGAERAISETRDISVQENLS
ncbi:MAG: ATP-binding protein [Pseudomonadota bacterium]